MLYGYNLHNTIRIVKHSFSSAIYACMLSENVKELLNWNYLVTGTFALCRGSRGPGGGNAEGAFTMRSWEE